MSESFFFHSPVKVFVEKDPYEVLSDFLSDSCRIGVVSGKVAILKTGFKEFLLKSFPDKEFFFYDDISENPRINEVIKGGRFLRDSKVEKIIAFGGGSALDAGKACAIFATNNRPFYDLMADNNYERPIPLLAVPTTCGTGSEMNHYCIITDLEKVDKVNFNKPDLFPKYAMLWSEYLKSLDETLLLWTVYDAFSHAMEGYLSKRSNRFSDILAMESMRIILDNLKSYSNSKRMDLSKLQFASALSGAVILHTGTTILHALGYYLTNVHGIQHGLANALLIPRYLMMCEGKGVEKIDVIRNIEKELHFSIVDSIKDVLGDRVIKLLSGVDTEKMVDYALNKPNSLSTPFVVTKDYILRHFS
ncbi:iron-containing alcohol dehydrogenase family protein [Calditerrivibrio nitroreducens]|uniref:Iron-containing alcohol dehydrogenase n=1 Tax=Calditerrivibrio nitroreducens (strain DSM 19672 / NBRC 101217 / Yu37-1) TaxID=768670 RepID=E4TJS8_CALNY|nr:iron-containing alcohol dehydrogenase family protein [Calditerrivibrio nitroreducens]ADR19274.1 iron-containing alcohol dehydrogenase [Calditerrivibrio nitroreducens DSM 19672]